jgi:hypothetical protein
MFMGLILLVDFVSFAESISSCYVPVVRKWFLARAPAEWGEPPPFLQTVEPLPILANVTATGPPSQT